MATMTRSLEGLFDWRVAEKSHDLIGSGEGEGPKNPCVTIKGQFGLPGLVF